MLWDSDTFSFFQICDIPSLKGLSSEICLAESGINR